MVHAPALQEKAHHGYEWRDVPKEDELVGAPRRHAQVLHLMLTLDRRTHGRPCALQVVVNQMVDNHTRCRIDDQRYQQDHCPAAKLIVHHRPTEDQDQTPQGPVDRCDCVKAERDDNNNVSELDVLLVVSHELVKVAP
ncbi:unnamed protein product [Sphagnum balticum]